MSYEVSWVYKIIDQYSKPLKNIQVNTKRTRESLRKVRESAAKSGRAFSNLRTLSGFWIGKKVLGNFAKDAIEFENSIAKIEKIMGNFSDSQLTKLKDEAKSMAAEFAMMPKQILDIEYEASKLGVKLKDMSNFTRMVARFSISFDADPDEAADQIARIQAKMGYSLKQTQDLLDAVAKVGLNSAAKPTNMLSIIGRAVPMFKQFGLSIERIAQFSGAADVISPTVQMAGASLYTSMLYMSKKKGYSEKMAKAPVQTMLNFLKEVRALPKGQRTAAVTKVVGVKGSQFLLNVLNNPEVLDKMYALVSKRSDYIGNTEKAMVRMLSTTQAKLQRLRAAGKGLSITLGTLLLPYVIKLTEYISRGFESMMKFIKLNKGLIKMGMLFLSILTLVSGLGFIFGMIATSIGILLSPITLVGLAIAGFVYTIYRMEQRFSGLKNEVTSFVGALSNLYYDLKNAFHIPPSVSGFHVILKTIAHVLTIIIAFLKEAVNVIDIMVRSVERMFHLFYILYKLITDPKFTLKDFWGDFKKGYFDGVKDIGGNLKSFSTGLMKDIGLNWNDTKKVAVKTPQNIKTGYPISLGNTIPYNQNQQVFVAGQLTVHDKDGNYMNTVELKQSNSADRGVNMENSFPDRVAQSLR